MPIWSDSTGSDPTRQGAGAGLQGNWVQRLRLWSGLVLMVFAASHLANHAIGLWSLADAEAARLYFVGFWDGWGGTVLLAGSALVHVTLALSKLYAGKTLRLPLWQWAQLGLGLSIPLLLADHVIATRIGQEVLGYDDRYALVTLLAWPGSRWDMIWLIAVVWLHGCLGVHYWARLYRFYPLVRPWLLGAAVLLPALGFAGFADMGQEVRTLVEENPDWLPDLFRRTNFVPGAAQAFVDTVSNRVSWVIVAFLVSLALVRAVRVAGARRGDITLSYPHERKISVPVGITVLEASRRFGIPHASVCGGRGRCSTCRVRIGAGADRLPPPSEAEERVLQRVSAPPGVRLACQIVVTGPLEVTPLLPNASPANVFSDDEARRYGVERELVIVFSDIRSFTHLAEHRLPYDVVFLLNQYFKAMVEQVETHGGHVDKFVGDGMMALFGLDTDRGTACRQALAAVQAMARELDVLNIDLASELREPLRIGMGVHVGPVIVGQIGYGPAAHLTAIGDTVNVASRLEPLTKQFQADAVISLDVAEAAGLDPSRYPAAELPLRGRSRPLATLVIEHAADIWGPEAA